MFCHACGRRASKGGGGMSLRDPFYCTGCDRTPGRCRCEPRPDDAAVTVECDDACGALAEPLKPDEVRAAYRHWREHGYLHGCSHGR